MTEEIAFQNSNLVSAIGATAAQLVYVGRQSEADYTLSIFPYIISTQVAQCTSMSSACVVYIWPFLKALQSGLLWSDNTGAGTLNPSKNCNNCISRASESEQRLREEQRHQYVQVTRNNVVRSEPLGHVQEVQLHRTTAPRDFQDA